MSSQVLLDCALDAVRAARSLALDAALTAQTPTLAELCALLDSYDIRVPQHLTVPETPQPSAIERQKLPRPSVTGNPTVPSASSV